MHSNYRIHIRYTHICFLHVAYTYTHHTHHTHTHIITTQRFSPPNCFQSVSFWLRNSWSPRRRSESPLKALAESNEILGKVLAVPMPEDPVKECQPSKIVALYKVGEGEGWGGFTNGPWDVWRLSRWGRDCVIVKGSLDEKLPSYELLKKLKVQ